MSSCFQGLWALCDCCNGQERATPGCGYFVDMALLKKIDYSKLLRWRSQDGGLTAPFPGPGSTAVLTHAECSRQLQAVPSRWKSGEIWRGNDLGFIRLNPCFWPEMPGNTFTLGLSPEQHAWVRPIMDELLGPASQNWNAQDIAADAADWLRMSQAAGKPFHVASDVKMWVQRVLHRLHLGIDLTPEEAAAFTKAQSKVLACIVLPGFLGPVLVKAMGLLDFRREWLGKYEAALRAQPRHAGRSDEDMTILASAMLDSLMFAGGLSTASVISCALATVYSKNSPCPGLELSPDIVAPLVWETVRYYPPVVGFPFYDGPGMRQRTCLSLASAQRDPAVWGDDCDKFVLRDLGTYYRASLGWADHAQDASIPAYSRACPAKDLSIAMATGFLAEWAKQQGAWAISDEAAAKIAIAPTTPFISNFQLQPV